HADFGGEVERVLKMADGVLLLVDAAEGPMPQTKFVLSKALALGLIPVVVVNKIDRPDQRAESVVQMVYDTFIDLGASDEQIEFPVVYASAKNRQAGTDPYKLNDDLGVILDAMIDHVPGPEVEPELPLQVLITNFQFDNYVGRIGIGRIVAGTAREKTDVAVCREGSEQVRKARIKQLQTFEGLGRRDADSAQAGEIVAIIGLENVDIGDTVCDIENPNPLPCVAVDEPTITMIFQVNDSPFAGKEGKFVTSRQVRDRLARAAEADVALRVEEGESPEQARVSGRGVLHLGILIENMRREGFEFAVGAPVVIEREIEGMRCEPVEIAAVDLPAEFQGKVIELLSNARGELEHMENHGDRSTLTFRIPSRGLIGMRTRVLTATRGEAVFTHRFEAYEPHRGEVPRRPRGAIIATDAGQATSYALTNLEDRGVFFVEPTDEVYEGMVVGEHCRDNDIIANVVRAKAMTDIRSSTKEATTTLKAPRKMDLEECLEWIAQDELLEVTPETLRVRKRYLKQHERKRAGANA
ncbi:MAG: translational GTPase TypA, partial [Planctomycetes bacterium]|nr:translational GTPase TypA [Planctomycetota bacterium]